MPVVRVGGACVRFLVAPPGDAAGGERARAAFAVDGVRGIRIYRKPGHVFRELRRASDRAGADPRHGRDARGAAAAAGAAAARIRFVTAAVEAVA